MQKKKYYSPLFWFLFTVILVCSFFAILYFSDPAIIRAARSGNINYVKQLLTNGANINKEDFTGKTPLMVAVRNEKVEMVKFLLKQGADVNINSYDLGNALHMATVTRNKPIIKILLENGANDAADTIRWAIEQNDLDLIKFLIEDVKLDVNTRTNWGSNYTLLMLAVERRNVKITKYLINNGADVNASKETNPCKHGHAVKSPLDILYHPEYKESKARSEIIDILKKHGALRGINNKGRLE